MSGSHSLLVVEDDLDVADMLQAYFRVQGYDVEVVNWGEDALKSCAKQPPDLIILDIRLPDIDGYEVARRLREDRHTESIPIIFLTEKRERADRLRGLELGADDYITKPFDVQELRLRVRNALRRGDQPPLLNAVTGLPESTLVDEQLAATIEARLGYLVVRLAGLDTFREAYGFLASDDALRAVSLMIANIVREEAEPDDFIGHLDPAIFVIATADSHLAALEETIQLRLEQAIVYFYPLRDRPDPTQPPKHGSLQVQTTALSQNVAQDDVERLKSQLLESLPG